MLQIYDEVAVTIFGLVNIMSCEVSEEVGEDEEDDQGENTDTSKKVEVPVDGDKHSDEMMKQSFVL